METFKLILNICEGTACLVGFINLNKVRGGHWHYFPHYLLVIFLSEIAGWYLYSQKMYHANFALYEYFVIPLEFLFFFRMFHLHSKGSGLQWLPVSFMYIYAASWLVDRLFLSQTQFWFYSFSYSMGNLLLLVLILRYFIKLSTSDAILHFKRDMFFWVSAGLLVYYLGSFPYYSLRNTIVYNFKELNITYSYIMYILNCFMYLMFALSFVLCRRNTHSL